MQSETHKGGKGAIQPDISMKSTRFKILVVLVHDFHQANFVQKKAQSFLIYYYIKISRVLNIMACRTHVRFVICNFHTVFSLKNLEK